MEKNSRLVCIWWRIGKGSRTPTPLRVLEERGAKIGGFERWTGFVEVEQLVVTSLRKLVVWRWMSKGCGLEEGFVWLWIGEIF